MRGVIFDSKHSWRDFGLVTNLISIGLPAIKSNYVDVPGRNGSLDLTESLGGVKYSNRQLDFEFTLLSTDEGKKSEIANYLHGKRLKISIDGDNDYYFAGRCSIQEFNNQKHISRLKVSAECEPYKYRNLLTVHKESISGRKEFICINKGLTVTPIIELSEKMAIGTNGLLYELSAGTHKVLEIQFQDGYNRVNAIGTGTVVFTYQEGLI